jgi:O-antigen ligase
LVVVIAYPRTGLYAMLLLVPLTDLAILESGATLPRVIGTITLVAWGLRKLARKELIQPLLRGSLPVPMLLFLSLAGVSVLWSYFGVWREAMMTYVRLVAWVFVLLDLIDSPRRLRIALLFLLIGIFISAGMVIDQSIRYSSAWAGLWARPLGGRGNPNISASTYLIGLPILFFFMLHRKGWQWLVALAGIGFLYLAIAVTVSRSAIVLALLLPVLQIRAASKFAGRFKYLIAVAAILLVILPIVPWPQIEFRFARTVTGDPVLDYGSRVWLAEVALDTIQQYPLLGRGLGTWQEQYYIVHNLYLEIASQLGITGFAILVWILVVAWQSLSKAQQRVSRLGDKDLSSLIAALRFSLLIYLLYSFFGSTELKHTLWLLFALAEICRRLSENLLETAEEAQAMVVASAVVPASRDLLRQGP